MAEVKTDKGLSWNFLISWILLVLFTCEHYSISFFCCIYIQTSQYKGSYAPTFGLLYTQLFTVGMFLLYMWFSWICFVSYIEKFEKILLRSSHQSCSVRIGVVRNFTKSTGKHLCKSLFFNKVAGLQLYQKREFLWILWNL